MLLKMAWADLLISYPTNSFVADVDLECLTALEARMSSFDRYLTYVIDSTAPCSVITLILHL
jgi:hypothetical protein